MRQSWTVAATAALIAIAGTISAPSPALASPTSPVITPNVFAPGPSTSLDVTFTVTSPVATPSWEVGIGISGATIPGEENLFVPAVTDTGTGVITCNFPGGVSGSFTSVELASLDPIECSLTEDTVTGEAYFYVNFLDPRTSTAPISVVAHLNSGAVTFTSTKGVYDYEAYSYNSSGAYEDVTVSSYTVGTPGDLIFASNGTGTVKVTGCLTACLPGALVIPLTAGGLPVTEIADYAFEGELLMTAVAIPNSVLTIGEYAFSGAYALASVTGGSQITRVKQQAFRNAQSLSSVEFLGSGASSSHLQRIDLAAFFAAALTSVVIPDTVTLIEQDALAFNQERVSGEDFGVTWCSGDLVSNRCNPTLMSLTLGSRVADIGIHAFYSNELTSLVLPASLLTLGELAFADSFNLLNVGFLGGPPTVLSSEPSDVDIVANDVFVNLPDAARGTYYSDTSGWTSPYSGLTMIAITRPDSGGGGSTPASPTSESVSAPITSPVAASLAAPVTPPRNLQPGQGVIVINGVETPVVLTEAPNGAGLLVTGAGISVVLASLNSDGAPIQLAPDGSLVVSQTGGAVIGGAGFSPLSTVVLYLFSDPILLGAVTVNAQGEILGEVPIPVGTPTGRHTIQAVGTTTSGNSLALSLAVTVVTPAQAAAGLTNPIAARVVAPGVLLVSQEVADRAKARKLLRPMATKLANARAVVTTPNSDVRVIVPARTPGARYDTSIKVNGKWIALGTTTADASGTLALPVIRPSRVGTYSLSVDPVALGKKAEFLSLVLQR